MQKATQYNDEPAEFVLASYPRSANHWLRYIVEFLSKRPTIGQGNMDGENKEPPIFVRLGMEDIFESQVTFAIKRHSIRPNDDRSKKLILVVRDYREAIFRHAGKSFSIFRIKKLEQNVRMYLGLMEDYQRWSAPKLLLCYENLIQNPEASIREIASFINKEDGVDDLLENLEEHQQRCVGMYDKCKGSHTKGKSTSYHSKKYGKVWKYYLDWRLKATYETLQKG